MRHVPSSHVLPHLQPRPDTGPIEWEELPSFAESLARRGVAVSRLAAGAPARGTPAALGRSAHALELDVDLDALAADGPYASAAAASRTPITARDIAAPGLLRHFLGL